MPTNPATVTAAQLAAALALRARHLRKLAGSRQYSGPANAAARQERRAEAAQYDAMVQRVMALDEAQLGQLYTLLAS